MTPLDELSRPEVAGLTEDAHFLWEASLDALLIVDESRRYRSVNDEAVDLLGAPAPKLTRRRIEDFTPKEHLPRMLQLWSRLCSHGRLRGEYEVLNGDGARIPVDFSAVYNFRPGRHLIVARRREHERDGAHVAAPRLTRREHEVLQLAAEGLSTRAIAHALYLSESTIKTYLKCAYDKLAARDRGSAIAKAMRLGIIS